MKSRARGAARWGIVSARVAAIVSASGRRRARCSQAANQMMCPTNPRATPIHEENTQGATLQAAETRSIGSRSQRGDTPRD